jgi:hypothetical protein
MFFSGFCVKVIIFFKCRKLGKIRSDIKYRFVVEFRPDLLNVKRTFANNADRARFFLHHVAIRVTRWVCEKNRPNCSPKGFYFSALQKGSIEYSCIDGRSSWGRSQSYGRELQRQRCKKFTTPLVAVCVLKSKIFSLGTLKNALAYYIKRWYLMKPWTKTSYIHLPMHIHMYLVLGTYTIQNSSGITNYIF